MPQNNRGKLWTLWFIVAAVWTHLVSLRSRASTFVGSRCALPQESWYPPSDWPDQNKYLPIKLLFSCENLYLVGFFCPNNNRWMVFNDSHRDMSSVDANMHENWTLKLHFGAGYGSLQANFTNGILGMNALYKLCRGVSRYPAVSEKEIKGALFIGVVVFLECIRFPLLRRRMVYALEYKTEDMPMDCPVPEYDNYHSSDLKFSMHFRNWSTNCEIIRDGEDVYNQLFEDKCPRDDDEKKKVENQRTLLLKAGLDTFTKLKTFLDIILATTRTTTGNRNKASSSRG